MITLAYLYCKTYKMGSIYVLQLEQEKYYVGKTSAANLDSRIAAHFTRNGSVWTKRYKPISIVEIISNCDDYDEDKHTVKYMDRYGMNNVRGGSFCRIELSSENLETLNQMLHGTNNKCYICGKTGHFANKCAGTERVGDEPCKCITSYFAPHRKSKCVLKNAKNIN